MHDEGGVSRQGLSIRGTRRQEYQRPGDPDEATILYLPPVVMRRVRTSPWHPPAVAVYCSRQSERDANDASRRSTNPSRAWRRRFRLGAAAVGVHRRKRNPQRDRRCAKRWTIGIIVEAR